MVYYTCLVDNYINSSVQAACVRKNSRIFPIVALSVQATEVKMKEVDFNPYFVSRMIPKLEWSALVQAAEEVSPAVPHYGRRRHISMNANVILDQRNIQILIG